MRKLQRYCGYKSMSGDYQTAKTRLANTVGGKHGMQYCAAQARQLYKSVTPCQGQASTSASSSTGQGTGMGKLYGKQGSRLCTLLLCLRGWHMWCSTLSCPVSASIKGTQGKTFTTEGSANWVHVYYTARAVSPLNVSSNHRRSRSAEHLAVRPAYSAMHQQRVA